MPELVIGDITLTRVVESTDVGLLGPELFPDWDPEMVRPHLGTLVPRHYRPEGEVLSIVIQSFLVKTPRLTILVDACGGNGKDRARPYFHRKNLPWLETLATAGARPEDIDIVLCTHMHVDHVGWNTRLENGRWVPTFPNARYVFAHKEWEHWQTLAAATALPRTGDYVADSVLPIIEAGRADLVDMDHEIDHGIRLEPLPGHAPGQVGLNLARGGRKALLCGDAMHHILQVIYPDWSTNFCTDQAAARVTRRALLDGTAETGTLLYPSHFPAPTGGKVVRAGAGYGFRFVGD